MKKDTLQEIAKIWEKLNEISKKLSDFTDSRHAESVERLNISDEALCDIDEIYDGRVADMEEALCEISEMLSE